MAIYKIKRNDTGVKFVDNPTVDSSILPLNGASVKFLMKNVETDEVISQTASITDTSEPTFEYQPVSGDVDVGGSYIAEWEVTLSNGNILTVPSDDYIYIRIVDDLG